MAAAHSSEIRWTLGSQGAGMATRHRLTLIRKLKVTQQAMERAMLGVSLCDKIGNGEIRRTSYETVVTNYKARRTDGRWGPKVLEWQPRNGNRNVGRSTTWWKDDI
ncbi:jg2309 [Pararge aegeria aegeria]|uniref:Jg2309 protein n=1 Tax=Pararge aegeria aegeria TaxID=348720 RepID=A0A8S4S490_9NEOP|nr:jg2309 [Pararge aegeria aegeria]